MLARDNWAVQREPADLRILIESARATRNAEALKIAADWIAAHRLEDVVTVAALGSVPVSVAEPPQDANSAPAEGSAAATAASVGVQ